MSRCSRHVVRDRAREIVRSVAHDHPTNRRILRVGRPRWRSLRVATVFGLFLFGVVAMGAPNARADTFCDLAPSADGVAIDFGQPLDAIRNAALQVLPFWRVIGTYLPAGTPKSVRSLFAADAVLVAKAAKVTTAKEARQLASRSVALSSSPSGKTAVAWLLKRCSAPDPQETPDSSLPTKAVPTKAVPTKAVPSGVAKVPTAPVAANPLDPCSLVTRTEATAALGADPGAARRPDQSQCVYGPGFADTTVATLTVALAPYGKDAFAATATLASNVRAEIGEYYQSVSVADRAFMFGKSDDKNPADSATVSFLKGDRVVVVNIFSPGGAARGHVVAVAVTAASRV